MPKSTARKLQLQHHFVAGMRFDKEVECLTAKGTNQYRPMPWKADAKPHTDSLWLALAQCAALLNQRIKHPDTHPPPPEGVDTAGLLHVLEGELPGVEYRVLESPHVARFGTVALESIRDGQLCLVEFALRRGNRWALVCGVEQDKASGQVLALLLLDAQEDEPWGCGYNGRISLVHRNQPTPPKEKNVPEHAPTLHTLSGEVWTVRLHRLVILQSRPKAEQKLRT